MAKRTNDPNRGRIRQPRIIGVQRDFKTQGLVPEVQSEVAKDAARFGVTESFVKAEIITQHYAEITGRSFNHISIEEATGKHTDRRGLLQFKRKRRA